ncbi:MAG: hypothetical protein KJN89_05480 [Gammaproteobacteria bacterium]|nr:hypothetical protein [Gammaproteobacteria bacterium]NNJ49805.1 hypothetical protein [Gammaproteobacteria bacterium]
MPDNLYLETGEVKAYAIRRVNPFLGVLQVIETQGGRAVSSNGVVWEIELRTERSGMWGSLNQHIKEAVYYRFGLWSANEGLVNRPLAPHLDRDPLIAQCDILIKCIEERLQHIPFKLIDNRELWLFDKDKHQPLALLASQKHGDKALSPEPKYWKSCLGANGVASQYRYPRATQLENLVERKASTNITKYWISREADGSGTLEHSGEIVSENDLPGFLLSESWPDDESLSLVNDYIAWIAPSLLSLQNLAAAQRQRLESNLNVQAVSIEHHWHLYPDIVDEKKLKAARVQCRMQQA